MKFSEDLISKVVEENNIVDVVSEKVRLKRSGKYYIGLCPFHSEKSPSFTVTPDKGIYKCFGCGEAGNVITFYMKANNLSFSEAVEKLAEKAHINITYENKTESLLQKNINKVLKINIEAARFYFNNLRFQSEARKYLYKRQIINKTINNFGLGFAQNSWNSLMIYLKKKGYTEEEMLKAGLIIKSEKSRSGFYDRFRNRIIFPVFDYKNKLIGFGGRVMDDSKPKYLNSPETLVFKKGTNLYGLNFAIKKGINNRQIIMVEGYMDCISLHQAGITSTVASLGTALTSYQAKLLKRYCDEVIISYDADAAGQNATLRGLQILEKEGFTVRVLKVPKGKDPDEFIKNYGSEAFYKLIDNALPLVDYKLNRIKESIKDSKGDKNSIYIKRSSEILAGLDPVEREAYVKKISEETGFKEEAIYEIVNPHDFHQNLDKDAEIFGSLYVEPAYMSAERDILRIMMLLGENLEKVVNTVKKDDLVLDSHKKIYDLIIKYSDIKKVQYECDDIESSKEFVKIMDRNLNVEDNIVDNVLNDCIKQIKIYKLENERKNLLDAIKENEKQNNMELIEELTKKLMKIQYQLGSV